MKKFYLFLILTLMSFSNVIAWDTTAAKLYPLQVGNIYVYEKQQLWGQSCIPAIIEGRFLTKITSDTILNGKKYFVFSGWLGQSHWKFQRIDSASMNVYAYISPSVEYLLDSLLGQAGDSLNGRRLFGDRTVISAIGTYNYLGQMRRIVSLYSWFSFAQESYQLAEGIGFTGMYGCKFGGVRYYITGCVINGAAYGDTTLTALDPISAIVPDKYLLHQNYPNPFNPSTNISFDIPKSSFVELKVFDISGREIAELVSQDMTPGSYRYKLDAGELPSGIYYYRLTAGNFVSARKMILLK